MFLKGQLAAAWPKTKRTASYEGGNKMKHVTRNFVVAAVFSVALCSISGAEAGSFRITAIDGEAGWFQQAWTWLSDLVLGADQEAPSIQAITAEGKIQPSGGTGGMATNSTGSCIDPMGNPIPCIQW
jgi:hypothetical protein